MAIFKPIENNSNGKGGNNSKIMNLANGPLTDKLGGQLSQEQALIYWRYCLSLFHYPTLNNPSMKPPEGGIGGCFNFGNNETTIDPEFAEMLAKASKKPLKNILEGVMVHEIGHYMDFPNNLANCLLVYKMTKDFCSEEEKENKGFQSHVLQTYADMVNDVCSVLKPGRRDHILDIREALQIIDSSKLRLLMLGYLRYQAGQDTKLGPDMQKNFDKMREIDFVSAKDDPEAMRIGIYTWMQIVRSFPPEKQKGNDGKCGQGNGQGEGAEGNGSGMPSDISIEMIKNASRGQIDEALRQITKKLTKGEYKRLKETIDNLRKDGSVERTDPPPKAITIGTSSGELAVDRETVDYYRDLAKNYPLVIVKKPMATESMKKSFGSTEKFRMSSDPNLILSSSSADKIFPGLTRKVKIIERPRTVVDYDTPHALIVIDSSGSMADPKQFKSSMVLAAVCAASSYHALGSKVGVINFSGDSFYLPYSRDLEHILAAVVAYQGGGTYVDVELLRTMLGKEADKILGKKGEEEGNLERILSNPEYRHLTERATRKNVSISSEAVEKMLDEKSIDFLLYSDLGIANMGEVIEICTERAAINRVTVFSNEKAGEQIKAGGKVAVYDNIKTIDDLVKATIGAVRKSISDKAYRKEDNYGASLR